MNGLVQHEQTSTDPLIGADLLRAVGWNKTFVNLQKFVLKEK
jgi:hypothetical protein